VAIDQGSIDRADELEKARQPGFGLGLLKGMGITLRHLFKRTTVIQYPDERQDLGPRTRGVIALKEENCTVCMLCARECPDWCIYIDSHKETLPPKREGGRPRKRNVLDRFAIDYALCMYCGICVEVCPYDALFWSREFEYAEYDIRELTHEKERLSDWMATVLPPPPLEEGAEQPGQPPAAAATAAVQREGTAAQPVAGAVTASPKSAQSPPATNTVDQPKGATITTPAPTMAPEDATPTETTRLPQAPSGTATAAVAEGGTGPGSTQRPVPPAAATAAEERPEQAERVPAASSSPAPATTEASPAQGAAGETTEAAPAEAAAAGTTAGTLQTETPKAETATPEEPAASVPNVHVPHEEPRPVALEPAEDSNAIYEEVLKEQIAKGSSPQVAEARARVARVRAERGIKRGPTPVVTDKLVPSAPTKGQDQPEASGAPRAESPQPDPGPVAATPSEASAGGPPAAPKTEAAQTEASTTGAAAAGAPDETPPDAGDTEESPVVAPGPPPDDTEEETVPQKIVETVAPGEPGTESDAGGDPGREETAPEPQASAATEGGSEVPDLVYERVYSEQKAAGSSEAVAIGRAKAAKAKAQKASGGGS
jgi:formate hydrogenlyase subunit 6/NADH:ubiquinone oxidoreductase subunit I